MPTRAAGGYEYTSDLLALEQKGTAEGKPAGLTRVQSRSIATPLVVAEWEAALTTHPDQVYVQYLNMQSARDHPEVVSQYLAEEVAAGRVLGPLPDEMGSGSSWHVSRFGVIPKPHKPNKWRLIVDLSHPAGASINDGIDHALCSLRYTKVEEIASAVLQLGKGTELAKADIKAAYRIVPVHPEDRHLLAMRWQGGIHVDTALPFGLRSAPKLFNAVADALEWCAKDAGVEFLWHYLDDYITVGRPHTGDCPWNVDVFHHVCERLGIPLAADKCEGPSTCLTFLGIEIDTVEMELRLPAEKLQMLQQEIKSWAEKKSCTRRELQSLTGQLQHAATVVRPGRTFLKRLYDLL